MGRHKDYDSVSINSGFLTTIDSSQHLPHPRSKAIRRPVICVHSSDSLIPEVLMHTWPALSIAGDVCLLFILIWLLFLTIKVLPRWRNRTGSLFRRRQHTQDNAMRQSRHGAHPSFPHSSWPARGSRTINSRPAFVHQHRTLLSRYLSTPNHVHDSFTTTP
jgi:hypothetical protein